MKYVAVYNNDESELNWSTFESFEEAQEFAEGWESEVLILESSAVIHS